MDEFLITQENESSAPVFYPRKRFIALFISLILLLIFITVSERYMGLKESESTDGIDSAISGDMQVKTAYFFKYLIDIFSDESKKNQQNDIDISSAVRDYRESVILSPIPSSIRKLIILDNSKYRKHTLLTLEKMSHNKKIRKKSRLKIPAEVAMWRDIYYSQSASDPDKVVKYSTMISNMKLGWYEHLALADLYLNKGGVNGKAESSKEINQAESQAFNSMVLFGIIMLFHLFMGIAGLGLLIFYITKISRRRSHKEAVPQNRFRDMPEYQRSFVSGYMLEAFLAYMLITIIVQVAIGGAIALVTPHHYEISGLLDNIISIFTYLLAGGLSLLYLSKKIYQGGWDWSIIGLNTKHIKRDIIWGLSGYATVLPLLLVAVSLSNFIEKIIPTPPNPVVPEILASPNIISRLILLFMVSVGAPVFEEIFFRGVLLSSLRARWGTVIGIAVSGIIFAFVHPFPLSFMPIFMLGTVFATLAYERSSLIPGMIAHSMNNTLIFIFMMLITG